MGGNIKNNTTSRKRYFSPKFLVTRVREKGVRWCLLSSGYVIYYKLIGKPPNLNTLRRSICAFIQVLRIPFSRLVYLLSWIFPAFRSLMPGSRERILAIFDFRIEPFTVGELLYLQEVSLILREMHQVDKIDLVLLCDANYPARADGGMDEGNFHYYFSKLLPLAFVNPNLGSLFIMDSPQAVTTYIADNHKRYYIFPPYLDANGRVLNRGAVLKAPSSQYFNYAQEFYYKYGYIPYLSCRSAMLMWARQFLERIVSPFFPIVVHLRNTSTNPYRNANLECWFEFFSFCETRYDVKFILIGDQDEIDSRFRILPNVVVSKDYCATIEQEMALIQTGLLYLGTTSGPCTMAIFNELPYLIYRFEKIYDRLIPGKQIPWANHLQKVVWEPETTERLIADFIWLYKEIDKDKWVRDFKKFASEAAVTLPRREHFRGVVIEGLGERSR